jgi:hypothetical protein
MQKWDASSGARSDGAMDRVDRRPAFKSVWGTPKPDRSLYTPSRRPGFSLAMPFLHLYGVGQEYADIAGRNPECLEYLIQNGRRNDPLGVAVNARFRS